MRRTLLFILIAISIEATIAQTYYTDQITVANQAISKKSGNTNISFDISLNDLHIDKNDLLLITPVIISTENGQSVDLESFAVIGHLRSRILDRPFEWKGKTQLTIPESLQIVRKNKTAQSLHYNTTLPFSEWQRQAKLVFKTEVIGCAECSDIEPEKILSNKILPDRFIPDYKMAYVIPQEQTKRSEQYNAHLNYVVGRWELLSSYKNNATILAEVDEIIKKVKENSYLTMTNFTISGYASPEDREERNMKLSQRRAESFADYIQKKLNISSDQMTIEWFGEDWEGLREAVTASQLANKEEILHIIDGESDLDKRDVQLKKLDNGATYNKLLREFYPSLRRNNYNISFETRPLTIEEAKMLIKTNPELLSLNEMFMVAKSYKEDSAEFKSAIEIGASTYPNSDTANINAAVELLREGNADTAIEYLSKTNNNPVAWNLMGIAYALKGDETQAKLYLNRAASNGYHDAVHNLSQLEQYIKDNI